MENGGSQSVLKLEDLKPNMKLQGRVTKIELFGAFIDVGLDTLGLVHISKLKRGKVNKVDDVVSEGQELDVWVENVSPEKGRLELTLIRPIELPWSKINRGLKMKGTVVRLEDFGAFVDIGAERPGLVHVSEISADYISSPKDLLKVGDEVEVIVLDLDRKKRQIRLSIKGAISAEVLMEEEEAEEEEPPTAMELALRKAMQEPDKITADEENDEAKPSNARDEQEDILSRTLRERMKTSTGEN